jgi:hypothetical protein
MSRIEISYPKNQPRDIETFESTFLETALVVEMSVLETVHD